MESVNRDALRAYLDRKVCQGTKSAVTLAVWTAVANRTLGYRMLSDSVGHATLRREAAVARPGRGLAELAALGVIEYRPGFQTAEAGEASIITVIVPSGFPLTGDLGDKARGYGTAVHTPVTAVHTPMDQRDIPPATAVHRGMSQQSTFPPGNHETSHEGHEGVVASDSLVTTARDHLGETSPGVAAELADQFDAVVASALDRGPVQEKGQDQAQAAREILTVFVSACRSSGHPVTRITAIEQGVRTALAAGYGPDAVLVGLGFWRAEGYCSPRQIAEMTERAATRGLPPAGAAPTELLTEGARRFAARSASPKETRKTATLLSIANYSRDRRRWPVAEPAIANHERKTAR